MQGIKYVVQMVLSVISFIWSLIGAPIIFIYARFRSLFLWYRKLWVKSTHNKYGEFVYTRGVAMAAATITSIIVMPTIVCLFLQTAYYFATYKKENIYLIQSEEIYPDNNTWAVRGCYTENCDSDSSLYYRIEPSLFHHLWNIGHSGSIFLPDAIGSSVPTGLTQCEVVSYGVRARVLMTLHIYPSILKITCEGYGTRKNEAGPGR